MKDIRLEPGSKIQDSPKTCRGILGARSPGIWPQMAESRIFGSIKDPQGYPKNSLRKSWIQEPPEYGRMWRNKSVRDLGSWIQPNILHSAVLGSIWAGLGYQASRIAELCKCLKYRFWERGGTIHVYIYIYIFLFIYLFIYEYVYKNHTYVHVHNASPGFGLELWAPKTTF